MKRTRKKTGPRARHRDVLRITLNGKVVCDTTVVKPGDVLVFRYHNKALAVMAYDEEEKR